MAKLGMPTINIAFEEAGIEAIERSKHGILALVLEDTAAASLKEKNFTVYGVEDIPAELSEENKDYITKALLGYVRAPYRVKVFVIAKGADEEKYKAVMQELNNDIWDYLAVPNLVKEDQELFVAWIKGLRDNKSKKVKMIMAGKDADYEGIINIGNEYVMVDDKKYTGAQFAPRLGGLLCGTPMTISATYAPVPEVTGCDVYDVDQQDEKVNKGEFFVWHDGEKYKMSRAINSLVATSQGKLEAYQTIKTVDVMDMIYTDIRRTIQDYYVGKYTNDYDNKCLLITAITGYFKELEAARLLQKEYSEVDIDKTAVVNYQMKHGLYTKDELAKMSDLEIKKLDTKKKVFLTAKVKLLDAMEDFDIQVAI